MFALIQKVNDSQKKKKVVDVRSGDTVRVHQKIKEGNKERTQIFEGTVIRTDRKDSLTSRITVRKIASGVGVEKSFLVHNPLVLMIEVTKRSKVRRNYLRARTGKGTRLSGVNFDREAVNDVRDLEAEKAEAEMKEAAAKAAEEKAAAEAKEQAELEKKQAEVEAAHKANA